MLIYNITFHIEKDIKNEFLQFIKTIYLPIALESRFLENPRLARIFSRHNESGENYSLQFYAKNQEILNRWLSESGELLHKKIGTKFGNKVAGFATTMQEIDLQE